MSTSFFILAHFCRSGWDYKWTPREAAMKINREEPKLVGYIGTEYRKPPVLGYIHTPYKPAVRHISQPQLHYGLSQSFRRPRVSLWM